MTRGEQLVCGRVSARSCSLLLTLAAAAAAAEAKAAQLKDRVSRAANQFALRFPRDPTCKRQRPPSSHRLVKMLAAQTSEPRKWSQGGERFQRRPWPLSSASAIVLCAARRGRSGNWGAALKQLLAARCRARQKAIFRQAPVSSPGQSSLAASEQALRASRQPSSGEILCLGGGRDCVGARWVRHLSAIIKIPISLPRPPAGSAVAICRRAMTETTTSGANFARKTNDDNTFWPVLRRRRRRQDKAASELEEN